MKDERLKPCPFCGHVPEILVYDENGKLRGDGYLSAPDAGVVYAIGHPIDRAGIGCPISGDPSLHTGDRQHLYLEVEDLVSSWNDQEGLHLAERDFCRRLSELPWDEALQEVVRLADLPEPTAPVAGEECLTKNILL